MSLLSHDELLLLALEGVIENVKPEQINASSIDITIGSRVLVEKTVFPGTYEAMKYVELRDRVPLDMTEMVLTEDEPLFIPPGGFILAQSEQVFNLPNNISAEYKLKSSMARIGLEHLNAGWCDAGWHGSVLTLELKNMTQRHALGLRRGDRIGQVVFYRHAPVADGDSYAARGRYNNDKQTEAIKP